jgi:hypothetical protein
MLGKLKQLSKRLLRRFAPRLALGIEAARSRAYSHRAIASWGIAEVNRKLVERFGWTVQEGPFRGTTLDACVLKEQIGPFLLGVYESELDGAWDRILAGNYTRIVDIGAKFGYYAVGLARLYPNTQVVAYDTDWWARRATRRLASANGISNVIVRSFCDTGRLLAEPVEGGFVLSDCEGYEDQLFSDAVIPKLHRTTLLIEVHESFAPGVGERLRKIFGESHDLFEWNDASPRRRTSKNLDFLDPRQRDLAEFEVRGEQAWFLFVPKS